MRSLGLITVAAFAAIAMAVPAVAQRDLGVPATASWKHAETGLILRPRLAGLARTGIADAGTAELDVSAQFGSPDSTAITVYIFRPALQSAPIWFDRVETMILNRDVYGKATPGGAPGAFAAPKSATASALRRVYVPGSGAFKSTAAAMIPLDEWLVAIRISSRELDPAALDAKLTEAIAAIGWPDGTPASPMAAPVAPCAEPLVYARRAKLKKPEMADALMGAVLMGMASDPNIEKEESGPVSWCREGDPSLEYGTYRANASRTAYVMAIGDAGRVINVGGGLSLDKNPGFLLTFGELDRTLVYPSFNGLPSPEDALKAVRTAPVVSSAARGGKDISINVAK